MSQSVLILNGPNLNMLGKREPEVYGAQTLEDLESQCIAHGKKLGLSVTCAQSNSEGEMIDMIQNARGRYDTLIINAGGFTHSSVALRDAVSASEVPMYEVHISNIHARESFRHHSYLSGVAQGVICGFGIDGYLMVLESIARSAAK